MIMYLSSKRFSFILYYVPIEEELNNVSKNGKGLFFNLKNIEAVLCSAV